MTALQIGLSIAHDAQAQIAACQSNEELVATLSRCISLNVGSPPKPESMPGIRPMLAKVWNGHHIIGWYASEKLNGVRALWDGENMWSRNGQLIELPHELHEQLPEGFALDGELFAGRDNFGAAVSVMQKKNPTIDDWADISYNVFDAPNADGGIAARARAYKRAIERNSPWFVSPIEHIRIEAIDDLDMLLNTTRALQGEGVVLRNPETSYEHKRTRNMLKIKFKQDLDAQVVEYSQGPHPQVLNVFVGHIIVKCLNTGKRFKVVSGLSQEVMEDLPKLLGKTVLIQHYGITENGHYRNASYAGVRYEQGELCS